ncbi:MAG: ribose-phosphate pyrophosphokinase-like domain-containing protein, partial [Bacteroidetes bacterium]|nr:ribose-phosphate pyrophosphokinase-like domain-containing protein [Bacteroidota bacterium]
MSDLENVLVFAGTGDEEYVDDVCTLLEIPRGKMEFKYFVDSDPYMRLLDNVGGKDVFLVSRYHQQTVHNWMHILCFANAALNEGANSV